MSLPERTVASASDGDNGQRVATLSAARLAHDKPSDSGDKVDRLATVGY